VDTCSDEDSEPPARAHPSRESDGAKHDEGGQDPVSDLPMSFRTDEGIDDTMSEYC